MNRTGDFADNGWIVLPERIEPSTLEAVVRSFGPDRGPDSIGGDGRVLDAWRTNDAVSALATHPVVLDALADIFGRRPIPFQTLNFSRGTEQRLHADIVHFDSVPSGSMCGVWVALEDVGPAQGPLRYVPGSHRLPPVTSSDAVGINGRFDHDRYEDLVEEQVAGMHVDEFVAQAGDALVWDAALVHGGAPVERSDSTRWSQVTHYFFDGAVYVTPMLSDVAGGLFRVRDPLIDISTGERVAHMVDDRPARMVHVRGGMSRILEADEPDPPVTVRLGSQVRALSRRTRGTASRSVRRLAGWPAGNG